MGESHRRIRIITFTVTALIVIFVMGIGLRVPKPSRIIMIGLDAADWDILDPLIVKGRIPSIQKIMDEGVTGKLETFEISVSPTVWTTISTGVTRRTHGIEHFVIPGTGNDPYNSAMRKVPAVWNILSHFNKRVGIVGHWVTWPAEKVNGHMVSSYISYDPVEGERLYHKGKLRTNLDIPGQTYPPQLIDEIQNLIVTEKDISREDLEKFYNIDDWDDPDYYIDELGEGLTYVMPWTHAADRTHIAVFDYLRTNKGPYDFLYLYIEGTDVAAHRYWHFYDTTYLDESMEFWGYDLNARDKYVKTFGDTLNLYYEWADEYIGQVMDDMGPRDTLIVLSDHGFGPHRHSDTGFEVEFIMHTFSGDHSHFGVIMFYGANVKKGHHLIGPPPRLTDVLPTVLVLMKLPIACYMEGRPIWDAISDGFNATYDEQWIDSYGIESQFGKQNLSSPLDKELVRRMKSLGYLQ